MLCKTIFNSKGILLTVKFSEVSQTGRSQFIWIQVISSGGKSGFCCIMGTFVLAFLPECVKWENSEWSSLNWSLKRIGYECNLTCCTWKRKGQITEHLCVISNTLDFLVALVSNICRKNML